LRAFSDHRRLEIPAIYGENHGKTWENLRKDGEIYGETMGKDGEKLEKCREVEKYIAKKTAIYGET
jgi:hypothetical protein